MTTKVSGTPAVSVIVPTYNAADTIVDQLKALARQTFSAQREVIVSDNGSTDETLQVVNDWAARTDWLSVVDASHRRGPSFARNVGARHARAPLLIFCDADDVVADNWMATMVAALSDADVVAGVVDPNHFAIDGKPAVSWVTQAPITMPFWPEFPAGATNNLGIQTAVFREIGGFDETLAACEDVDLCWRAQSTGYTFTVSASTVVAIRRRIGRRAVARQAFAYGKGEDLLRRKHDVSARAYHRADDAAVAQPSQRHRRTVAFDDAWSALRRASRVVARLPLAQQQADILWRCSYWLGFRTGRLKRGAP